MAFIIIAAVIFFIITTVLPEYISGLKADKLQLQAEVHVARMGTLQQRCDVRLQCLIVAIGTAERGYNGLAYYGGLEGITVCLDQWMKKATLLDLYKAKDALANEASLHAMCMEEGGSPL